MLLHPDSGVELGVSLEVLLDELGHRQLPGVDDEFISRAVLLQGIGDTLVKVITHDWKLCLRAKSGGVETMELPEKYKKQARSVVPPT